MDYESKVLGEFENYIRIGWNVFRSGRTVYLCPYLDRASFETAVASYSFPTVEEAQEWVDLAAYL